MRGILASSIGVTCAAALALPLAPPAAAAAAGPASTAGAATRAAVTAPSDVPGSTQSLPLRPLAHDRATGATVLGLTPRAVRHFSLLGVIWDDPAAELAGRVQVRTRSAAGGDWSGWRDVETHYTDHGADPGASEAASGQVRGATAPLWVGESDGVEVRVRPEPEPGEDPGAGDAPELPSGLRLELIDPGDAAADAREGVDGRTGPVTAAAAAASAANARLAAPGADEIPELDGERTQREFLALRGAELTEEQRAKPHIGPRPAIVTRRGWGADEGLRKGGFVYTSKVKAAFVHHTASGNNYSCSQAPSLIRGFYRYHVRSLGWRDIGYNFLVDKCGRIYEGRAGGVAKAVKGAHTLGFNTNTTGIAVIGSYGSKKPSSSAVKAVARLTAWKLGLHGMNPRSKTYLTSGGGNLYRKGKKVRLNVISGHRDGFNTSCPGGKLYKKLGTVRSTAARYQGR
ncbi:MULTISPECIES: peptidoglycan recognition protein [unclassified Streptomyces]|uniref:peptidoglycan recognition protein family protein n=1 Tax=unclassified Streptomyces TaxID=2593676 RepID=UPI000F708EC7|nr:MULTISPECIES: peptidoglycan recognition protein [unclassified Streptomyces]AZM64714.1 N-acetylmuramoyl-L-alanine amidase [Streptomyces sp. WAC 01438]RSM87809.1 N-acetylmuramoyl-L-alanine amidase [Streptomyces sp. WAC 01420]